MELHFSDAAGYLAGRGMPDDYKICEPGGGVSNTVLLVEGGGARFVLKQAPEKLRVKDDWFSDRSRIFRESEALQWLKPQLMPGSIPEILFEDRENFLFAMSAAAPESQTWKEQLLCGCINTEIAARIGRMLAAICRVSWRNPDCQARFGDQTVFEQLRIDPYYRTTAARHPDLRQNFQQVIDDSSARRFCLVHGDWSPKNFLVAGEQVMAIDFEVIHFGDPAFDSAFMLNHLLLKSSYRPQSSRRLAETAQVFWETYSSALPREAEWIESATVGHLGCLLLARIDGKSPVEYLQDTELQERVREFARALILDPPTTVAGVFTRL